MSKTKAITEFDRIIRINHKIVGDITNILNNTYDKGFEIGKTRKQFGDSKRYDQKIKSFNFENFFKNETKKINPFRISNIRNIKYNGPEITCNQILVCDFTIQQTLDILKQPDSDYGYFERKRADEKYYFDAIKNSQDDEEEIEYLSHEYNCREVEILLLKLYQLGYSDGYNSVDKIPRDILIIFGIENSDLKNEKEFIELLKKRNPNWEQYTNLLK